ncbi:uncharacterized protein LOC110060226 [Orbicella faveolata]|uniref:uncharacterized protein LOC110060226 n=1 Tax=Orbicella faveolata TaxID=48498 RepID=UPI0009E32295|nr:uncharacterized protein LOC110060226 [Orbicella faveolata]
MPITKGKKNKRGSRGSTEEKISVLKRPNMATDNAQSEEEVEEAEEVDTTKEPNLYDIQTLLISIQRTTENILKENNKLSNEVGELKSSLRRLENELLATKTVLSDVQNTNKELRVKLDAAKQKISLQRDELNELYDGLDNLEQYSRKNSLEIVGIPESIRENEGTVLKIANALDVQVKPDNIDICHRVKRKKSSPIIVRFVSHKVKSSLYKQRVRLRNVQFADIFPDATAADRVQASKIFINENLMAFRRELVGKANARKEELSLLGVWTIDSKVFVKTSPGGRPIRIYSEHDLNNL